MREPELAGPGARAWDMFKPERSGAPACLAAYLVNAPGCHNLWQWWSVSVVHLRDCPGAPPAAKQCPQAEHEIVIYAINPEACPNPDPDDAEASYPHLVPLDLCEQFWGLTDAHAAEFLSKCVRLICDGRMSPDSDFRRGWRILIASETKTAGGGMCREEIT